MAKYKCLRCRYRWTGRLDNKPRACPACKSYVWDTEIRVRINWKTKKEAV